MTFSEKEVTTYFEIEAAETWETIRHHFLLWNKEEIIKREKSLKDLVNYRDIIDYKLYLEAIDKIFPDYLMSKLVIGDVIEDRFGHRYFKTDRYEFEIWPRGIKRTEAYCRIRIRSTGSRTSTVPIAMSIISFVHGDTDRLFGTAHPTISKGQLNYEENVTTAIIDYFYLRSKQIFGMTSSQHRDSAVYAELMMEEGQREEYSKLREVVLSYLVINEVIPHCIL